MGILTWAKHAWSLRKLLNARWVAYGLAAVMVILVIAMRWAFFQGVSATEGKYIKQMNIALESQMSRLLEIQQQDLAIVTQAAAQESRSEQRIDRIAAPVGGLCTPDGVLKYNAAVRAAEQAPGAADG